MTVRFGARLHAAMDKFGPLCVGIDPHPSLLAAWGLPDDAVGLRRFSETVVDALAGRVAAVAISVDTGLPGKANTAGPDCDTPNHIGLPGRCAM